MEIKMTKSCWWWLIILKCKRLDWCERRRTMEEQQLKQKQEELAQHQQKVAPSLLACLCCHHQHHQLHHQHYHLDLHHILTKSPSQMREAEQRLAEEQQSMLGLQVKILPALWTQCWSWQWSWSWSWQWSWSWYRYILVWLLIMFVVSVSRCKILLLFPFWRMMVVGKIIHNGHSANCARCASSPGRGWRDVAGRGNGHQWLEHRRRADQHPGGACRPSHGGQVQTK